MRISDADRQRVVEELGEHLSAGRLDLDAYSTRLDEVLAAETLADLDHARRDLPFMRPKAAAGRRLVGPGARPATGLVSGSRAAVGATPGRWWARLVLVLTVLLVVAGVVLAFVFQVVWLGLIAVGWLVGIAQGRALRSRR